MLFLFLISVVHCKNDFVVRHLQILIFENVKNEHSVEKLVSVTDTVFLSASHWYRWEPAKGPRNLFVVSVNRDEKKQG